MKSLPLTGWEGIWEAECYSTAPGHVASFLLCFLLKLICRLRMYLHSTRERHLFARFLWCSCPSHPMPASATPAKSLSLGDESKAISYRETSLPENLRTQGIIERKACGCLGLKSWGKWEANEAGTLQADNWSSCVGQGRSLGKNILLRFCDTCSLGALRSHCALETFLVTQEIGVWGSALLDQWLEVWHNGNSCQRGDGGPGPYSWYGSDLII